MSINAIVGGQWGDEGKGKIVDLLSKDAHIVARYQGGSNAGHTVYIGDKKIILHQIPTGILRIDSICILGNGMVIDPIGFTDEITCLIKNNINFDERIMIDYYSHIVTPLHKLIDSSAEKASNNKIGTTCKGIGPTYQDKYQRIGIRAIDILDEKLLKQKIEKRLEIAMFKNEINAEDKDNLDFKEFYSACKLVSKFIQDTFPIIYNSINKNILIEGAQGTLLDIDHGTYPYVTSSNCSAGGISTGLGIPGNKLDTIIGIFKAYVTRVGGGPFPSELFNDDGEKLQSIGMEVGATTGRPRRCGWFDLVAARYSCRINGLTGIALTKLDILDYFKNIQVCTHYEYQGSKVSEMSSVLNCLDEITPIYKNFKGWNCSLENIQSYEELPVEAKEYIKYLSSELEVPIQIISIGPKRNQILHVQSL
ncbi:adenylosuccinate synthase [Candidatus Marinimicrobia bacterium]|nr:adenylosuccinate synthase [Candidatus Neomarinimicrobiota bacterium]